MKFWSCIVLVVYSSYCIKLGLKQRTQTPEIRKIRNLSTTKNTVTILISQETNSQETALPERRNALPDFRGTGSSTDFHGTLKLRAWVAKAKTEMEPPGSPFVQRRGFLVSNGFVSREDGIVLGRV